MFENLLHQSATVGLLSTDLEKGRLPASLLFCGPEYSGKSTAALELARALSCRRPPAAWQCACASCERNRLLLHPAVVHLGGRYFYQDIAAACDTLTREPRDASRFLLTRAARRLTRRFDAFLWEGEDSRLAKIAPSVLSIEESLESLAPGRELPPPDKLARLLEGLLAQVRKVCEGVNLDAIGINQVRRLSAWLHVSAGESARVVIIENAERMNESARNALLKSLEEPPRGVYFILLTTRRGAIIPTILSRVRTYLFQPRDREASEDVLLKIFRVGSGSYPHLREFFLAFRDVDSEALRQAAARFLSGAGQFPSDAFADDRQGFRMFLHEVLECLRPALRARPEGPPRAPFAADPLSAEGGAAAGMSIQRLKEFSDLVRRSLEALDMLNMSPGPLLERMAAFLARPADLTRI